MDHRNDFQIAVVKLVSGERLLRLSHGTSGLAIEKKLDPRQAIIRQKEQLFESFKAALLVDGELKSA